MDVIESHPGNYVYDVQLGLPFGLDFRVLTSSHAFLS